MEATTPAPAIAWSCILLRHPKGDFLGDSDVCSVFRVPTPAGARTWASRDALRSWLLAQPSHYRKWLDAGGFNPVVLDSRLRYVPEDYVGTPARPVVTEAAGYQ